MESWNEKYPYGSLVGDSLPGAPELAVRGKTVTFPAGR